MCLDILIVLLLKIKNLLFRKLFQRKNFQEKPVNQYIATLAHDIRNFYQRTNNKIRTPDAIHLATAIYYNAEKFYTFDGAGGGGLLRFDGNVAGYELAISKLQIEPFGLKRQ